LLGSLFINSLAGRRDPTDRVVIHLDPCREQKVSRSDSRL
jgi:hypothetical protein